MRHRPRPRSRWYKQYHTTFIEIKGHPHDLDDLLRTKLAWMKVAPGWKGVETRITIEYTDKKN